MYIGNDLQIAHPSYKIIDDISSGFNGSTTSFALQVSGATPVPFPISTQQVMISVNGVVQEPDPNGSAGFKLLGSNIVFSSAPANGHAFFGVINAGADYVTAGSEFPDGSATAPSFTFQDDQDTGWFRNASGDVGYSSNGAAILNFDGNGLTIAAGKGLTVDTSTLKVDAANNRVGIGLTTPQVPLHLDGANTRIQFTAPDTGSAAGDGVILGLNGDEDFFINNRESSKNLLFFTVNAERMRIDSSGRVLIGTTTEGEVSADNLTIADSANCGITIRSGSSNAGAIYFSDGTSGDAEYRGLISYNQSSDYLHIFTGAAERLRIDASGRLLVGHTASIDQNSKIQAFTTGTDTFAGFKYGGNSAPNIIRLGKSRNASIGGNTIVADDDEIGRIGFVGADGSDFRDCAAVHCFVDGTPGSGTDMPGRLVFSTTADGSGSLTERLRIDCRGFLGINESNPDELLHISANNNGVTAITSANNTLRFTDTDTTATSNQPGGVIEWETLDSTAAGVNAYIATKNSNTGYASMHFGTGNTSTLEDRLVLGQGGDLTLYGTEGTSANLYLIADQGDDNGDGWRVGSNQDANDLTFANNATGSYVDKVTVTGDKLMLSVDLKPDANNQRDFGTTSNRFKDAYFAGTVSDSKGDLRKIPVNAQTAAYTLVLADAGKCVTQTHSGGVNVPYNRFSAGDAITIINNSGSDISIVQGSSNTMYNSADGATGNRTLSTRGMATVFYQAHNVCYISGAGLS
jgi:hypothetical protein